MYNFDYVDPQEEKLVKDELHKIIHEVQNTVKNDFTFQFKLVGSSGINMVTYDRNSNIGFDFDLEVSEAEKNHTPKEIRHIIKNAIDRTAPTYGYKFCEDSTRV